MVGGRTCWVRFGKSPAAAEAVCGARGGCLGRSTRAFAPFIYRVNGDAGGETCSLAPAPKVATLQSRRRTLAWASARDVEDGRDVDGCRASTTTQWFWRGLRPSRANRFRHQNAPPVGDLSAGRQDQPASQPASVATSSANPFITIPYIHACKGHPSRDDFKLPPQKALSPHKIEIECRRQNAAKKMRPRNNDAAAKGLPRYRPPIGGVWRVAGAGKTAAYQPLWQRLLASAWPSCRHATGSYREACGWCIVKIERPGANCRPRCPNLVSPPLHIRDVHVASV